MLQFGLKHLSTLYLLVVYSLHTNKPDILVSVVTAFRNMGADDAHIFFTPQVFLA